jgi:type I restriction enzyme S subunit
MSWKHSSLSDVSEKIDYGVTASANNGHVGPKFLRITDIQDNKVDWNSVPYCEADKNQIDRSSLSDGDIVFARTGATTGKSFLIRNCPNPSVFASYLIRVRVRDCLLPEFVAHFFQSPAYWAQVAAKAVGAAQPGINASKLGELQVPVPPLDEQKRIAMILDQADELRRKRQRAIDRLNQLGQAIFHEMFGDPVSNPKGFPVKKLGEIGDLDRGISKHRPRNDPALLNGDHPLIQTGDVANADGYIRSFVNTYSDIGLRQSRKWPAGTLCITIAANIGKTAILEIEACFPDSVVGFTPGRNVNAEYVQFWMERIQKRLEEVAPQSAQKNINLAILRELPIPLPEIGAQSEFKSAIYSIEKQKSALRRSAKESESLFASLQAHAFRGEL